MYRKLDQNAQIDAETNARRMKEREEGITRVFDGEQMVNERLASESVMGKEFVLPGSTKERSQRLNGEGNGNNETKRKVPQSVTTSSDRNRRWVLPWDSTKGKVMA